MAEIQQAEAAGVQAAWATMGGAGGVDMLPVFAVAAAQTERILLGNCIVHTWSRQPVAFAQEAMAIEGFGPGRFRLGIGPTTQFFVERMYGQPYTRPLTNLREYLTVIRALLHEGSVSFEGFHVSAKARISPHAPVPVMASALRPKSYELCGELADGAISWMSPLKYLTETALPALQAGASAAGREAPPLVAHVPIAVTTDREAARQMAREQLSMYARVPNYQGMFAAAGYEVTDSYTDPLLDDLVVSGTEAEVAAGLQRWIGAGMGEVIAHPLIGPDREGSLAASFAAVARAAR
ncbi:MAG: LLM class flavin-dependent oxidoreductase [Chloroflexi bacterium]|nr:LLM class flavin-dependent oxidoreductase [Chloroflexota bacterium]MDA1147237.1 LLM class flavin-dependent oxidoreductase [Chloroflexota bacterium]